MAGRTLGVVEALTALRQRIACNPRPLCLHALHTGTAWGRGEVRRLLSIGEMWFEGSRDHVAAPTADRGEAAPFEIVELTKLIGFAIC